MHKPLQNLGGSVGHFQAVSLPYPRVPESTAGTSLLPQTRDLPP